MSNKNKPLGKKCYGSIGHLPNSRMGPSDSAITPGQSRIATVKKRDKHDNIVVQEKLDGSCVGVAKKNGELLALTRKGYLAETSNFELHHWWGAWVKAHANQFDSVIQEGERICGEWLTHAHGTIYELPHQPFVAFDIFGVDGNRFIFKDFCRRINDHFTGPRTILYQDGSSISIKEAVEYYGEFGFHGAKEQIEGYVWRVERKGAVNFLCKYVRSDKIDGKYLNGDPVLNTWKGNVIRSPILCGSPILYDIINEILV